MAKKAKKKLTIWEALFKDTSNNLILSAGRRQDAVKMAKRVAEKAGETFKTIKPLE